MKTYQLKYGRLIVTGKMTSRTLRLDTYIRDDGTVIKEICHVTGPSDESAPINGYDLDRDKLYTAYYRQYDCNCPCCYGGFNHSTALHDFYTAPIDPATLEKLGINPKG